MSDPNVKTVVKKVGSRRNNHYIELFMLVFVLFVQGLNIWILITTKFTWSSLITLSAIILLFFSVQHGIRQIAKEYKERRELRLSGNEFCNLCDGQGYLKVIEFSKSVETGKTVKESRWGTCAKCRGTGKIDWVQKVIDPRRLS